MKVQGFGDCAEKQSPLFSFHRKGAMTGYRYEAQSIEGFIQQVAVQYVARGYWFYVSGIIPEGKNPQLVAEKLIGKYGIAVSKFVRARRKVAGRANLQLVLHGRIFLILATHGEHPFFEEERTRIRDCREAPIKFASYAVSFRGGHANVRIDRETERDLKAYLQGAALWSAESLKAFFSSLPFEPYAPIRRQLLVMLNQVNRQRVTAGLQKLPTSCLRLRRKPLRPFELEAVAHGAQQRY